MRRCTAPVLLFATASLAACGHPVTDSERVRRVIDAVDRDPASLCTRYATPALLAALGSTERCLELSRRAGATNAAGRIESLDVLRDEATVVVSGKRGRQTIALQKRSRGWLVASVK